MWKRKISWLTIWQPMLPFNSKIYAWVKDALLHVILPNTCYACRGDLPFRRKEPLCQHCAQAVKKVEGLYCKRCGKPLSGGGAHCYRCRGSKAKNFKCKIIRSALIFGPEVRSLVHAFKYAHQSYLACFLAEEMLRKWPSYPELAQADVVIPVPLHAKKYKKRGYNQSFLLAKFLGEKLSLPVEDKVLQRVKDTPSQTGFGRLGRIENMKEAFQCPSVQQIKGKIVLLIDDVTTTGATLEACAVALRNAGAKKVMAYTLARER